ncbi:hypothetical protein [Flavisolibacter ginsengisoli]|jgi:hypothetical protein|uniref:Choline dehydrogenase n=1 Tax=Flavisolibacter ginsengisoli DSM 18119 TaxID=1121884 RepID=A0A1M5BAF8_9BACT|nr:hypothetical protein [Flavisolibacter ginsengisoli]SHF39493.1 hypothetical protein SAMN02745131_02495 [Flavisolibacter ginsengisoli DSM 18119]
METICILGAGTYGSYLANAISKKFPQSIIKLVEVGDSKTKNEEKAGFLSFVKSGFYDGIKKGRYFGLGGTSARWAGQLLFFSENDCPGDKRMQVIKHANIHYKDQVLRHFFKKIPDLKDYEIKKGLFFKQGIWLKFSQRNFFTYFKIKAKQNVQIIKDTRIVRLNVDNSRLVSVSIKNGSKHEDLKADKFYLTCGAFESLRLLGVSGIYNLEKTTLGFRDRISMRGFTVLGTKTKIFDADFQHKIVNNSLLTSRIIGDVSGSSFYMKAIFNGQFAIWRQFKNIFSSKNSFSVRELLKGLASIHHVFPFAFNYLYHKKLYVYKTWEIFVDIELDENDNKISLSKETDKFGELGLDIYFNIPDSTKEKIKKAKAIVRDILIQNNLKYKETDDTIGIDNLRDTLHPYNLYNSQKELTFEETFNPVSNLFVLHTGILSRVGGINPTATLLCLIEKHVTEDLIPGN